MNRIITRCLWIVAVVCFAKTAMAQTDTLQPAQVKFAGLTWNVKMPEVMQGPGPNYWSGKNVWVDDAGYLHLKVSKNEAGLWTCAEVATAEKFGFGTYEWIVDGELGKLDQNMVLGLFNYSGENMFDEMDIEIARWGNASYPNLNYTIYPAQGASAKYVSHAIDHLFAEKVSLHRFTRYSKSVLLESFTGDRPRERKLIARHVFSEAAIPVSQLEMPVFINFWLFKGMAPINDEEMELVIRDFKFTPSK